MIFVKLLVNVLETVDSAAGRRNWAGSPSRASESFRGVRMT